ncbi:MULTISPECIES: type IV-A pilus assembly ATPase PilB [Eikenella]|jgi:type IV-A pilus assembly ATPase pilB|uniref:Type II traffic warden ATPase n=2 Tax=Eikenella corrodens TaxID=539 RepID=A0A1A9RMG6_EIKCO|nr:MULTISPECIES: type IV-A pilus assembly ATPase PilB [Eikenella]EEG23938.1 type IV-A pilus assembly ATPase PilB [Eikenella corrodens ATCC 23834]MDN8580776.1 type IV-A pilus assembly ATPase PilB [Eikenella corrodens]MDN8581784.1 type IV-A pilus assembly ATPase PilB [Eikenella corrodens]MDU1345453.1 type IV-A pilus assembly ATPase PilB [Eikenella corrodens]MDU4300647.1 type IV-A pilus assembly ATPase PilB [Eikenella corrodens]
MSVGLLRILFQNKLIEQDQVEKYREKVNQNKNIIPMLAEAGIIKQADLALLLAKLFHYPILDLSLYSRSMMVQDVLNDSQMTEYRCVPLFKRGQKLFLGVSDPTLLQTYQKLVFPSGLIVDLILVNDEQLDRLLEFASQTSTAILDEISADSTTLATPASLKVDDEEEDGPIAKFIHKVLSDALNTGASDIHFEFYEEMARIRFRTDGQLREVVQPPLNIRGQIASRIKVMSKMDISEKRVPQDGRIQIQFNKNQKPIDFRVNTLPTLFGEKIVMRILNSDAATLNINQLGFEPFQKELLLEAIHRPYGMVLVTGPTGSGKTVSLYTCLNILNTDSVNISTAEDPAEINLPGINQVNVNDKQGMTFAAALKAFLRQDPDIIMVGEIRDLETADIAIKAAQTGHMVFSTLHTNNAPATLSRMLNMGVAPFNIASSVNLIMAQRLVRRLCTCKQPIERPPAEALLKVGFTEEDLAKDDWQLYRQVGCDRCKGKGFKGRAGVYEIMPVTDAIQKIIINNGTEVDIAEQAYADGLVDLRRAGILKAMQGITTLEEILASTND